MLFSPLNLPLWTKEFETDLDEDFMLDGIMHGFQLLPEEAELRPVEMHKYFCTPNANAKDKVETTLLNELASGNYIISGAKPRIVSAFGAVPKPDCEELQLIHDCSMPSGLGFNSYIASDKQRFQIIYEAVALIKPGYYMAKVDLASCL